MDQPLWDGMHNWFDRNLAGYNSMQSYIQVLEVH